MLPEEPQSTISLGNPVRSPFETRCNSSQLSLAESVSSSVLSGTKPFTCSFCNTSFTRLENLRRHIKKHAPIQKLRCHICNKEFSRKDTLKLHTRKKHPEEYELLSQTIKDTISLNKMHKSKMRTDLVKEESMLRSLSEPNVHNDYLDGSYIIDVADTPSPLFLHANFELEEISTMLDHYWTYFHPLFPLIHRPTFDPQTADCTLLSAMCTVGLLYIPQQRSRSAALCEKTLKVVNQLLYSTDAPIETIQATLILIFYGTYADRVWYKRSRALHSQIIAVARETGIFQSNPLDKFDDEWSSFIASEGRKRTSFCLYMIDSQMVTLLNYPPSLSHYEIKHMLPCLENMWEAETASTWRDLCSQNLSSSHGVPFLEALQQTLIYGRCPRHISSFGSLTILSSIYIIIRNMAQYAGVLDVPELHKNDTFSRKPQLGAALNALRSLVPKKERSRCSKESYGMWDMFVATWNLAYIHLHIPDPIITSGIVEVTLRATIASAAVLAKPHTWYPPNGTSLPGAGLLIRPNGNLSVVIGHICYFLKISSLLNTESGQEKSPVLTFMFYKAGLVAWQILNVILRENGRDRKQTGGTASKSGEVEYVMQRLIDDVMTYVDFDEEEGKKLDDVEKFEKWMRKMLLCADTWSVGLAASASFFF